MPSKHNTLEDEKYQTVSVKPSYDGKRVLKTMANGKGDQFMRIASRGDQGLEKALSMQYVQYKPAESSKNETEQRKSEEITTKKHAADNQNGYYSQTKAHHVLYTKTPAGTVYKKAEESAVKEYSSNRGTNRTSEMNSESDSKKYVRKETTTRVSSKLDEVDTSGFDWKPNLHVQTRRNRGTENGERYRSSRNTASVEMRSHGNNTETKTFEDSGTEIHTHGLDGANDSLVNGTTENKEESKNFTEEADRLIKIYKKKYGSRDNLDEIDKDVDYERKLNDTRIKEMLKEKTVEMRNHIKTEANNDKRSSGIVAKINRKDACFHCGDSVYQKERIGPIRDVLFHAYCFRCTTCGTVLNLYNYYQNHKDMHDRAVYCKSHQPSPESSKVDISDKSIQAFINKPKLERVSSNVRAGQDSKSTFGKDAVSIKNAMNAPKLGTYNPTVRVTIDSGCTDHIDTNSMFVQTAMKAPKLDVYNATVRPVPTVAPSAQNGRPNSQQRNSGIIGQQRISGTMEPTPQSTAVHYGFKPLHSLYLHQP